MLEFNAIVPRNLSGLHGEAVIQAWRERAEEIAAIEHHNIEDRTPMDTGTLDESLTEVTNPDPQTIAEVYTNPDVQLSGPWERVYAQYQEGPPLGHTTYTHTTPHFFYDVLTEDLGEIAAWAKRVAREGVATMEANVGTQSIP